MSNGLTCARAGTNRKSRWQNELPPHFYAQKEDILQAKPALLLKPRLPTHYFIDSEDGLELPSIILMEQLRTIDKHRLGKYIGHLKPQHINGMNRALAVSIHLNQQTRRPRNMGQSAAHIVETKEVSATEA